MLGRARQAGAILGAMVLLAASAQATPLTFDLGGFSLDLNDVDISAMTRSRSLGTSWNVAETVGGFTAGNGLRFGGETSGTAALNVGYEVSGIRTDLNWGASSQVSIERVATGFYKISASLDRNAGSSLHTDGLKYGASATFALDGDARLDVRGCLLGACGSAGKGFSLDATQSLLKLGTLGSGPFQFLGKNAFIDFGSPYVLTAGTCGDIPECTLGMEVARITGFDPSFDMTGNTGSGAGLSAERTGRTVTAGLDLDFLFATTAGATIIPPGGRLELGPTSVSFDLYDLKANLSLDLLQRQSFSPGQKHTVSFDRPVQAIQRRRVASFQPNRSYLGVSCGTLQQRNPASFPNEVQGPARFGAYANPLGIEAVAVYQACYTFAEAGEFAPVAAGQQIELGTDEVLDVRSDQAFKMTAVTAVDPTLETDLDLNVVGSLDLAILQADGDFDIYEQSIGPVFATGLPLFNVPLSLFTERRHFDTQTCGMSFAVGPTIQALDDSFFCGRFSPGTSGPELVFAPEDELPPIPALSGTPFDVPEPGSLALLLAAVVIGAVGRRRVSAG